MSEQTHRTVALTDSGNRKLFNAKPNRCSLINGTVNNDDDRDGDEEGEIMKQEGDRLCENPSIVNQLIRFYSIYDNKLTFQLICSS